MTPLVPHPSTPEGAFGVAAGVERTGPATLRVVHRLVGALATVRVPPPAPSRRADRLWEHTCCEAFVRVAGVPGYVELNASPSSEWAAYGFARYREGGPLDGVAPRVSVERARETVDVETVVTCDTWSAARILEVGLSAVVETTDGRLSYWALRHPADVADFHHPDAFVLRITSGEEAGA